MRGSYELVVRNNRVQFKLVVRRNITILRGDSATGKTTLIDMIDDLQRNGQDSGVFLKCERPCVVLSGRDWESRLAETSGSIVFVDEGNRFTSSEAFARAARACDNYFIIAARESLFNLPYSVNEIYGIGNDTRQRCRGVWRYYSSQRSPYVFERGAYVSRRGENEPRIPTTVVVEDSGSGYQFFRHLCSKSGISCLSAESKAKVYATVCRVDEGERVLVITDGAAFGPELERMVALMQARDVQLFLPESFEWLLLESGLVHDDELPSILADPVRFIESRDYFSWERFFTDTIKRLTRDIYLAYQKGQLNPAYLQEHERAAIEAVMPVRL